MCGSSRVQCDRDLDAGARYWREHRDFQHRQRGLACGRCHTRTPTGSWCLNESSGPGQDYSVALPDYFDWRNDNTVFEHLACTHKESRNLSGIPGREPERISCASVTRNFFNIIGLPPEIGRTFSEDEDKVGAPPVVVISDRLWRRVFNADPECARAVHHFARSEFHRHRRDAAASYLAPGQRRLVVDDAAEQ